MVNFGRKRQKKVREYRWSGVEPQLVNNLPVGIDGLKIFIMKKSGSEENSRLLRDGRRWKKSCPTDWLDHKQVRFADCRGSHKCVNDCCPFKVQFGVINTKQFEKKKDLGLVCKGCGMTPTFVQCPARRYISTSNNQVKVYHYGQHTCPVIQPTTKDKEEVSKILKQNPKIKPSEIQSSCILSAFREGADWQKVEKKVEATLDRKWLANLKQKIKKDTEPAGHDFEAVVTFKQYCDKKDEFYVYKINDNRGNPDTPSFVFKSSKQKAKMALQMEKKGEHFLKDEYCFFDGKRKRCRGFVTLTASVYHPLLRKQIPLAIMDAAREDSENIELFWTLFNEILQKVSGRKDYKFDPIGFCTDMAGANFAGITRVFGSEMKSSIKSCEFHFKEQVNKRANRLRDEESSAEFKEISQRLLESTNEQAYNVAKKDMDDFINRNEERDFLKTWISWWHDRRGFIFRAFSPKNAPEMNQAEVVHASWAHRDSPNLSLLDACQADVRDSFVLDVELKEYEKGTVSVGTGPSYGKRKERQHQREVQRAKQMGKELLEECEDGFLIDPSSSHKPPQKRRRKGSTNPKRKKPGPVPETAAVSNNFSATTANIAESLTIPSNNNVHLEHTQHVQPNLSQYSFPNNQPPFVNQPPPPYPQHQSAFHSFFNPINTLRYPSPSLLTHPLGLDERLHWNSGRSPHPYEIVAFPSNVKKCYGCGSEFVEQYKHSPYNLIIKHLDRRVMGKDALGALIYSTDFTNTYYHPSSLHIKRKNPNFNGVVLIDKTLWNSLNETQRQVLASYDFKIFPN